MSFPNRRDVLIGVGSIAAAVAVGGLSAAKAAGGVLKIGQLGVMSGPNAAWGLTSKYSAEAIAALYNDAGGVEIDGTKYTVEVVSVDDKDDPKLAVSGLERLASEGVRYVIGPNTDATASSSFPISEKNKMIYFPYSTLEELFKAPAENVIMATFNSPQVTPVIFEFARDQRNVKRIAILTRNTSEDLRQRDFAVAAAEALGLEVVSSDNTYESGTTEFFPVMTNVVGSNPDLIHLPVAAPATCPQIMRAGRELGFSGAFSADTSQDLKTLMEGAGDYANGLLSVGGAAVPGLQSDYMSAFKEKYIGIAGEWNEEAGNKAYALQIIVDTIKQAGAAAIDDIEVFKKTVGTFSEPNPFLKEERPLTYTGESSYGRKMQIGLPLVVTEVVDGQFNPVFIGQPN